MDTPIPALSRSATEPTARPGVIKRATFPNLPGLTGPPPPNPDVKAMRSDRPKRRNEGTDSDSRSSSHLSKRRKYSTEPSESYNLVLSDPSTGLKALNDGLKLNGMIFYPDALAKASENFRNMSLAYVAEKASRKETFEAALKRATRRANDADHKLQDVSQTYADKAKAQAEAHTKIVESFRAELQAIKSENESLVVSEAASREALKTASESPSLRNSLLEKEEQLAMFEHFRTSINVEIEQLTSLHASAVAKANIAQDWQQKVSDSVNKFNNDLEDMGMKTIKRCGTEIQSEVRYMITSSEKAKVELEKIATGVEILCEKLANGAKGIDAAKELTERKDPVENSTNELAMDLTNDQPDEKTTVTEPAEDTPRVVDPPSSNITSKDPIEVEEKPEEPKEHPVAQEPQELKESQEVQGPMDPVPNKIIIEEPPTTVTTNSLKIPWL